MRIVAARLNHETNTFSLVPTPCGLAASDRLAQDLPLALVGRTLDVRVDLQAAITGRCRLAALRQRNWILSSIAGISTTRFEVARRLGTRGGSRFRFARRRGQ